MAHPQAASSEGSAGRTAPPAMVAEVKMQGEGDTDIQDIEIGAVTHFRYCVHMQCSTINDTGMAFVCSIYNAHTFTLTYTHMHMYVYHPRSKIIILSSSDT